MKLVEGLEIVTDFHEKYMADQKDFFLVALMSYLLILIIPVMVLMIPFTLYMKLPIVVELVIPAFLSIVPIFAWSRVFIKWLKFKHTLQFYPERLI